MITIKTSTSKIVDNNGDLASGVIIIEANDDFEYLETGNPRKVTTDPKQIIFTDGLLAASFSIAPTLNATQDKTNLYYKVVFRFGYRERTEYWVVDASGPAELEITAVTTVIPDPVAKTEDFISSDLVSVLPIAYGIPRAKADGTIDAGWVLGIPNATPVYGYPVDNREDLPTIAATAIALGYVLNEEQAYACAGGKWRMIGG